MKTKFLLSVLFLFTICLSKAQMDDNFYKPNKVLRPIENLNYEEFSIPVQNDMITGII